MTRTSRTLPNHFDVLTNTSCKCKNTTKHTVLQIQQVPMMMNLLSVLLLITAAVSVSSFQAPSPLGRHPTPPPAFTSLKAVDTLQVVNDFYTASPYAAAAITCGTKASAADYVAQIKDRNDDKDDSQRFELARNAAFLLYGAMYQGMAQEYIYNHLYPLWFGSDSHSIQVVLTKVCFDLLIQTTLLTLPIAYLAKALIFQYSPKQAMELYVEDICEHGLLQKFYVLWGPVQCLTFSIVPETYRVTFVAAVSFFWIIILSSITSRPSSQEEAETN